jgi:hypothetical protein
MFARCSHGKPQRTIFAIAKRNIPTADSPACVNDYTGDFVSEETGAHVLVVADEHIAEPAICVIVPEFDIRERHRLMRISLGVVHWDADCRSDGWRIADRIVMQGQPSATASRSHIPRPPDFPDSR